jgi:DNA-nicking Smr family endonuclease
MNSPLLVVDVAHPPRPPHIVEDQLLDAWSRARNTSSVRLLKIIHGHGSSGKGGSTREFVRNWAYQQRTRFRAVIPGEAYTLFDGTTQSLRQEIGNFADPDLQHGNPGITVLWIR